MFAHWLEYEVESLDGDLLFATPVMAKSVGLTIPHCCRITNSGLQTVFKTFHTLEEVYFATCTLDDETLISLGSNHPQLNSLRSIHSSKLTDASVIHLATHCSNLGRLQLNDCIHLTDAAIDALAVHSYISDLYLAGCPQITNPSLVRLATKCESYLRVVDLSTIPNLNAALHALGAHCPLLEHLSLNMCANLNEPALLSLIDRCQSLKVFEMEEHTLSREALLHMSTHISPELADLQLFSCPEMTDEILLAFMRRSPTLEALYINTCPISNASLLAIATHLPGLVELDVQDCPLLSLEGVRAVARDCRMLNLLDLSNCPLVCSECLAEIAAHSKVSVLGLVGATAVTDDGIKALGSHLHTLTDVNLAYMNVSEKAVHFLMKSCPLLRDVSVEGRAFVSVEVLRCAKERDIRLIYGIHPNLKCSDDFVEESVEVLVLD